MKKYSVCAILRARSICERPNQPRGHHEPRLRPSRQRSRSQEHHRRPAQSHPAHRARVWRPVRARRRRGAAAYGSLLWHHGLSTGARPGIRPHRFQPHPYRHHDGDRLRPGVRRLGCAHHLRLDAHEELSPRRGPLGIRPYRDDGRTDPDRRHAPGHRRAPHPPHDPAGYPHGTLCHDRPHAAPGARATASPARSRGPRGSRRGHAGPRPHGRGLYQAQLLQPVLGLHGLLRTRPDHRGHLPYGVGRSGRVPGSSRPSVRPVQPHLRLWRRVAHRCPQPIL